MREIVEADLTWSGDQFERGVQIAISDGRIEAIGALGAEPALRLRDQALLPGFISAHSHAFQRALRGRGESFPAGAGSFWSWREAMYGLVTELDEQRFYDVTRSTFEEMLEAGITTVGEFHYLHHSRGGRDHALDEVVLDAARHAGIRIVLLVTYYKTGGIGQPPNAAQKRFETPTLDDFWRAVDALSSKLDTSTQSLGVAAHSIRGVPLDEIAPLYREARRRGMPFHMHLEEQRREIEESIAAYGSTPLQLVLQQLESCDGFTAVHATHSDPRTIEQFLSRGGSICITPLTEANLGDGIPRLHNRGVPALHPSLGTDSNARISMIEEMRWLEYAQRLATESRGVIRDEAGRCGSLLLDCATRAGARVLGVNAGRLEPDAAADFVTIDPARSSLIGVAAADLLDAIVFGAGNEVIRNTCVGGRWRQRA